MYSTATDVWAFGVVLWELAAHGKHPYEKVPHSRVLIVLLHTMDLA